MVDVQDELRGNIGRSPERKRSGYRKGKRNLNNFDKMAIKVKCDAGSTPRDVAAELGLSTCTIRNYKKKEVESAEAAEILEFLKEREVSQLHLITGKARIVAGRYLDEILEGKREINPIAVTAIQDRNFQQRQLLEGKATSNVNVHSLQADLAIQKTKLSEEIMRIEEEIRSGEEE